MEHGGKPFEPIWMQGQADKEAKSDVLSSSERYGQLVAFAGFLVVIAFVAIHQTRPTGFFTDEFGTGASVLLYGMFAMGIIPLFVRFFTGRKNSARLIEAAGMALFFVGQLYFLVVFPFEFSHFADPLPASLEFLLDWVPASLAKVVLGIGVVGSGIFSVYTIFLYQAVRKRLVAPKVSGQEETK